MKSRDYDRTEQRMFPDRHNLPKPRWRDALRALAGPAVRLHRLRNLRSAMFYESIDERDCGTRS